MRQAFTLIELMIVIAIIAIIAAIAIPNLLESRITANESAAAASLKSGILAAQTQFQGGAYADLDSDGRGEYAADHKYLAGTTAATTVIGTTPKALSLIAPSFNFDDGTAVGAYKYRIDINLNVTQGTLTNGVESNNNFPSTSTAATYGDAESYFAAYSWPNSLGDGRRAFGINIGGSVFATKQTYPLAKLITGTDIAGTLAVVGTGTWSNTDAIFVSDPRIFVAGNNTTNATPYTK